MFPAQGEDQEHRETATNISKPDDREAKHNERELEAWLDDVLVA